MKELDFTGKVFVVTGAASGIGRSCAEQLLESGAMVIGIDLAKSDLAYDTYKHYMASITDEEAIRKITDDVIYNYGKIDGLVNAAGIWGCNMANTATAYIKNCGVTGAIKGNDQTSAFSGYAGTGGKTVLENCWFISEHEVQGIYQNKADEIFIRPGGDAVKFVNCYTNQGSNKDPLTSEERYHEITADIAETGELTYRLNGNQSEIAWYQTLGEDMLPTLDKTHKQVFFSGETACNGDLLTGGDFSNDGENNVADHEYTDGVCDYCGAEEPGFAAVEIDQFGFYLIDTADKFAYIAKKASSDPTINIRITEDLDLGGISEAYQPIIGGYAGTIDGGGHIISNFIIDRPEAQMQALIEPDHGCNL